MKTLLAIVNEPKESSKQLYDWNSQYNRTCIIYSLKHKSHAKSIFRNIGSHPCRSFVLVRQFENG